MAVKKIGLGDMDWDDLRVFVAVARAGNLSQAARLLRLDHSTVSRRIAQLEFCVGGALFQRHRSGFQPTDLARTILPFAEAVEGGVIGLQDALEGGDDAPSGVVRLATMEGIGSLYLARRLPPLMARHPALRLELLTSPQQIDVSRREADIFLSFFEPSGRFLHCERAGSFVLSLYASPAYLQACGEPASPADLSGHRFVGYLEDLIQLSTVRWLDEVITEPNVAFRSNSMIAQMAAAAGGAGLVLLPRFAVEHEPGLRPVLEREVVVRRGIWLSAHHDLQYTRRVRVVMNFLAALFAADDAYLNGA
jgi:DNA-binding transcriptional LysR family regulator